MPNTEMLRHRALGAKRAKRPSIITAICSIMQVAPM
jgi:hypothetical protein